LDHIDIVDSVKFGDLGVCDLLAAVRAWLDCQEGKGYDTKEARRQLADFDEECADMPWVGNRKST